VTRWQADKLTRWRRWSGARMHITRPASFGRGACTARSTACGCSIRKTP